MGDALVMPCPKCHADPHAFYLTMCDYCAGTGSAPDIQLSPNFRLSEFVTSQTAIRLAVPNDPPPVVVAALRELCVSFLEPVRALVGPLHVDSGFRSPDLNRAVGGAVNSAHRDGLAADTKPLAPGMTLAKMAKIVLDSGIIFDQCIVEYSSWLHLAYRGPAGAQRRQALMIFKSTGYLPLNLSDSRIIGA